MQFTPYPVGGTIAQKHFGRPVELVQDGCHLLGALWGPETASFKNRILQRVVRAVCEHTKDCPVEGATDSFCVS